MNPWRAGEPEHQDDNCAIEAPPIGEWLEYLREIELAKLRGEVTPTLEEWQKRKEAEGAGKLDA
jgi:hypothetical protein